MVGKSIKNMPIGMSGSIQSVVVGDAVYIGGGSTENVYDERIVMKLDLQKEEWTKLPEYNAKSFAMTSLDDKLVLLGGSDLKEKECYSQVGAFDSGQWIYPLAAMNTARYSSTAVTYNNHIIVVGGLTMKRILSSVEILDAESRRWYTAEPLPCPRYGLKSTILDHTLHLMGGRDDTGLPATEVHKVDLNNLIISKASKQTSSTLWQTIEDTPLSFSTPLAVGGCILTIGGRFTRHNKFQPGIELSLQVVPNSDYTVLASSPMFLYQADERKWVRVREQTVHSNCTCVFVKGKILVAGGEPEPRIIYFLSLSDSL